MIISTKNVFLGYVSANLAFGGRTLSVRTLPQDVPDAVRRATGGTPRSIVEVPLNSAVLDGSFMLLDCAVDVSGGYRIQWYEYQTDAPNPMMISIDADIVPNHPYASRYDIMRYPNASFFSLLIDPVHDQDGGSYQCFDALDASTNIYKAQLIIISKYSVDCSWQSDE